MGLLDFAGSLFQTFANRRSQNRQNEFNAQQAELNRQFQSQEAQIARDWQEQQYNLYSSPSAMVRQYQDAGLNPALMYGQNLQSSTGSSPAPSGSMASGSALGAGMPTGNIIDAVAGLAKLKAEIDNVNADTENKRAQADATTQGVQISKDRLKQDILESDSRIDKLKQELKTEAERTEFTKAQTAVQKATEDLLKLQGDSVNEDVLRKQAENAFMKENGYYPDSGYIDKILQVLTRKFGLSLEDLLRPFWLGPKGGLKNPFASND